MVVGLVSGLKMSAQDSIRLVMLGSTMSYLIHFYPPHVIFCSVSRKYTSIASLRSAGLPVTESALVTTALSQLLYIYYVDSMHLG